MTDYITRDAAGTAIHDAAFKFEGDIPNGLVNQIGAAIRAIPSQPAGDYEAICVRLEAPAYWISGSGRGHEGENDVPKEAAAAIRTLVERVRELEALKTEQPSQSKLPTGDKPTT